MVGNAAAWYSILTACQSVFTTPSWHTFSELMTAWVLCTGRKTITGMLTVTDSIRDRAHDTYHGFLSHAVWHLEELFEVVARVVVELLPPESRIHISFDDTLFHKTGRHVVGAEWWRDAVRSTKNHTVTAWGLNLLVLAIHVPSPWGGAPLALPVYVRLHKKNDKSLLELTDAMISVFLTWFPGRRVRCTADGFYAPLVGKHYQELTMVSRIRRDAALYHIPPVPTGKRKPGRPCQRGPKYRPLEKIAAAKSTKWSLVNTMERGKPRTRLIHAFQAIWWKVSKQPVLVVISRDPEGKQPDDFFVSSLATDDPATVISDFTCRWSIEIVFRDTKQSLAPHHPQAWVNSGPERAAALGFLLYSLIWVWFIHRRSHNVWEKLPWYPRKATPSFADALAHLRRVLWLHRITDISALASVPIKFFRPIIAALVRAA